VLRREVVIFSHREQIAKIPIFSGGRDVAFIANVVQRMRPAAFPTGQFIVSQGYSARGIYFIISGVVEKLVRPHVVGRAVASLSMEDSNAVVKDVLQAGDFFGHETLFVNGRHAYGCRTFGPCYLYVLSKEDIGNMVDENPIVALKLQRALQAAVSELVDRKSFRAAEPKIPVKGASAAAQEGEAEHKREFDLLSEARSHVSRAADAYHTTHRSSKPMPLEESLEQNWRLASILNLSPSAHHFNRLQASERCRRMSAAGFAEQAYMDSHTRLGSHSPQRPHPAPFVHELPEEQAHVKKDQDEHKQ